MRLPSLVFIVAVLSACEEHGKGGVFPDGGFGSDDGGTGRRCGGIGGGSPCLPDEFCDFALDSCGATDEAGTCTKRPQGCPDIAAEPTCGCDGTVFGGACDANAAGVDVDALGNCPLQPGTFKCGFKQCNISSTYCEVIESFGTGTRMFTCKPLPPCTGQPTCTCLANEQCGASCSGTGATGLTAVCQTGGMGG